MSKRPSSTQDRQRALARRLALQPKKALMRSVETGIALTFAALAALLWVIGEGPASLFRGSTLQSQTLETPGSLGWLVVTLAIGIMLLNALFVAAETAIQILRPMHLRHFREEGNDDQTRRVQKLIDQKINFVAAAAFGSHFSRFLLFLLSVVLAPSVMTHLPVASLGELGALLLATVLVAVPLLLVNLVVELVPRSYAALHPHRVSLRLYRFMAIFSIVFSVPARLVTGLANLLTTRFGGKATFAITNQAEEEIKTLVESAQETGEIEVDEKELLHSVFEFTDTVVREVMTPRVDIDATSVRAEPAEVLDLIQKSGHSRIPLYEDTDDAIVGIIHAKDLLMAMLGDAPVILKDLMRPPMFIPENKNLHDLLQELRTTRSQMAVVQDEFGGTSGIVTIEDIVEELVGDIVDEYDTEEPGIVEVPNGHLVDGKTHLDDVNHALGMRIESDEFDTIAGYVFGLFGRQPQQDETIEGDGYIFTVAETDGRRIMKLKIESAPVIQAIEG